MRSKTSVPKTFFWFTGDGEERPTGQGNGVASTALISTDIRTLREVHVREQDLCMFHCVWTAFAPRITIIGAGIEPPEGIGENDICRMHVAPDEVTPQAGDQILLWQDVADAGIHMTKLIAKATSPGKAVSQGPAGHGNRSAHS